jgi:hypothetical protein
MSYHVYISSAARDSGLAQDLGFRLQEIGAEVSSRQGVAEASPISLDSQLLEADEVVVLLTDHSVNSQGVLFEMGAAWGQHKRLTPVVVGLEDPEVPALVRELSPVKYMDLRKYLLDLAVRVRESRGRASGTKPKDRARKSA